MCTFAGCAAPAPVERPASETVRSPSHPTLLEARADIEFGPFEPVVEEFPTTPFFDREAFPAEPGELAIYVSGCERDESANRPALIWLPGSGRASRLVYDASWFQTLGLDTYIAIPTFRGTLSNPGRPEALGGEVSDLLSAAEWVRDQPCVDPNRVIVAGRGEGATVGLLAAVSGELPAAATLFDTPTALVPAEPGSISDREYRLHQRLRSPIYWVRDLDIPTTLIGVYYNVVGLEQMEVDARRFGVPLRTLAMGPADETLMRQLLADGLRRLLAGRPIWDQGELQALQNRLSPFKRFDYELSSGHSIEIACRDGDTEMCRTLRDASEESAFQYRPRTHRVLHDGCVARRNMDVCVEYLTFLTTTFRDPERGIEPLADACDRGDTRACYLEALIILEGAGAPFGDPTAAMEQLVAACEAGEVEACTSYGLRVKAGLVAVEDSAGTVVEYLTTACEGGDGWGCNELGVFRHHELGAPPDETFELYQRACDLDYALGCSNVGDRYRRGVGVDVDLDTAFEFATRGCRMGSEYGCEKVARLHWDHDFSGASFDEGWRNHVMACMNGRAYSCRRLAEVAEDESGPRPDRGAAFYFWDRTAELYRQRCHSDASARDCTRLANLIQSGKVEEREDESLLRLRLRACQLDDDECRPPE